MLMVPLMQRQRDAGYDVSGVAGKDTAAGAGSHDRLRVAAFPVYPVHVDRSLLSLSHPKSIVDYLRLFRREHFDVVHVHTPIAALLARVAARIARTPVVIYTAHGLYFQDHTPRIKRSLAIAAEWVGGRFTHLLLSQSSEDAATARRLHLSKGPIVEIGNGVDPRIFTPDPETRAAVRRELGCSSNRPVVLIVARLVEEKGYIDLFEAFEFIDADLWIIGTAFANRSSGNVEERLDHEVARRDRSATIRYLGNADVARHMKAADIFVLPSYREGMPRSVLEAMMCGLPVVATNIRGSREEIKHEETGLLVDVGDPSQLAQSLSRLVHDPALRATLGASGRLRAVQYYVEQDCLDRQLDAIDRVIEQRIPRGVIDDASRGATEPDERDLPRSR